MNVWLKAGKLALVLALALSVGGAHWAMLQTAAWTSMLIRNAHNDDFATALLKTFDGKHPCSLCLLIREGKQQEQKDDHRIPRERTEKMPELFCELRNVVVPTPPALQPGVPPGGLRSYSEFVDSPPRPPPRDRVAGL